MPDETDAFTNLSEAAKASVQQQYKEPSGIDARIRLHANYSLATISWPHWVVQRARLQEGDRVLEVGCGSAWLWNEAASLLPVGVRLTLTDQSEGMVKHVAEKLRTVLPSNCEYRREDVQALSFPDGSFDLVVANHMLYLVPDRLAAFAELRRVLTSEGRLLCATNGKDHLKELDQVAEGYLKPGASLFQGGLDTSAFNLDNGEAQLREVFGEVVLHSYEDGLRVTEPTAVVDYVNSMPSWRDTVDMPAFTDHMAATVSFAHPLYVTKSTGLFEAWGGAER